MICYTTDFSLIFGPFAAPVFVGPFQIRSSRTVFEVHQQCFPDHLPEGRLPHFCVRVPFGAHHHLVRAEVPFGGGPLATEKAVETKHTKAPCWICLPGEGCRV